MQSQDFCGWAIAKIILILGLALGIVWVAHQAAIALLQKLAAPTPETLIQPMLIGVGSVFLLFISCTFLEWQVTKAKSFFSRSFSLILLLLGILYFIGLCFVCSFLVEASMTQWGVPTTATIQEKFMSWSYDADTNFASREYNLRYQYTTTDGKTYTGTVEVKRYYYDEINEGDDAMVYYLPQLPRWSSFEAENSAIARAPFLFTMLFTFSGWLLALGAIAYIVQPLIRGYIGD